MHIIRIPSRRGILAVVRFATLVLVAAVSITPSLALPGHLVIQGWGVEQIDANTVQLWIEVDQPPTIPANPQHARTYIWVLDTDCNPATGQEHGSVGSEYNVRVMVTSSVSYCFPDSGGMVDCIGGCPGWRIPGFVDGKRITARLDLRRVGSPTQFRYKVCAFENAEEGDQGGPNIPEDGELFTVEAKTPPDGTPARVVVEPSIALRHGITSTSPSVKAYDVQGRALALTGRTVKLCSFSPDVTASGSSLTAAPGKVTLAMYTATVDGVMSCDTGLAMVGDADLVPGIAHLDLSGHLTEQFSIRAEDASGATIDPSNHALTFSVDTQDVATVDGNGLVTALPTGAGSISYLRATMDGFMLPVCAEVRVMTRPSPLLPEIEARGNFCSFWYAPVDMDPIPLHCRFEEMVADHHVPLVLDAIYANELSLVGSLPSGGWRQNLVTVCSDDVFGACGWNGNPVVLGFDPWNANSCVQLGDGVPHWGVMSHEIGHNMTMESSEVARVLMDWNMPLTGAYCEGLASLAGVWSRHEIVAQPDHCGVPQSVVDTFLDPDVYDSLPFCERTCGESLTTYMNNGADYMNQMSADVMDGIFLEMAGDYGWGFFPRLFSIFWPPYDCVPFQATSELERSTFFVAAMSAAVQVDLRSRFREWGFPIDDSIYEQVLPDLEPRSIQRFTNPAIASLKSQPDGPLVELLGSVVTHATSDAFYAESVDRCSGIKVRKMDHGLSVGDKVNIEGYIGTDENGERCLDAGSAYQIGDGSIGPVAMSNRQLGGSDWHCHDGGGQPGVSGSCGLNNIGLLVRISGRVTNSGRHWFYMDDGSRVNDGSGIVGLFVDAAGLQVPPEGAYVAVTGISGCEYYCGKLVNVLRLRTQDDIQSFSGEPLAEQESPETDPRGRTR